MNKNNNIVDLAIINGKLVIPDDGVYEMNLYINDGKIYNYGDHKLKAREIIDAKNNYVIPGIIDPHVHYGLFVTLEDEIVSESKAAVVGGVTTVGNFIGGDESHLDKLPNIIETIEDLSYVDMIPHLVIQNGEQKSEIPEYIDRFNVKSFKVYMNGLPGMIPSVPDKFILDVMNIISSKIDDGILCVHTENEAMVNNATEKMKKKYSGEEMDTKKWADTHPREAEYEAVHRIAALAKHNEMQTYIVHLFSKLGVDLLSELKYENDYISVETTSPYLSITKEDKRGNLLKMAPPFHSDLDRDALWNGINKGVIDTIGTDNVTMTRKEKNVDDKNYWNIIEGYAATEYHLPIILSEGVNKRNIPIERVISAMTKKPAEKFGVYPKKGSFNSGSDADIVIIDMEKSKTVELDNMYSRSDFSIYEGRTLKGWPILTIKDGNIVAKDGKIVTDNTTGKYIRR